MAAFQDGCFSAVRNVSFDSFQFSFVNEKLCLWVQNDIPEIEQSRRCEDFFQDVVIPEVGNHLYTNITYIHL